jgi:hypothetical protein
VKGWVVLAWIVMLFVGLAVPPVLLALLAWVVIQASTSAQHRRTRRSW